MTRNIRIFALVLVLLLLLSGCSWNSGTITPPTGDVNVTVQYLPEKVDNPENLPVLKWLCMTDFGDGGGQGRVWNETAVHQLNEMLAQRNMPYRIQFIMLTNNSMPGYYNWFEQKEVKKLLKEVDLVYGSLSADERVQHLMPITEYASGQKQPSLESIVPYEECWDYTTIDGEIYGIKGIEPNSGNALGWYVAKKVIDEYGFSAEDFQGKHYWEMDEVFARLYEKNNGLSFLAGSFGGTIEAVTTTEGAAQYFVPGALDPIIHGRFKSIGAFYAIDYGQESPRVVNILETEYIRGYQEAIIRYADAGYIKRSVSEQLVSYGNIQTDALCEDEIFYYIPVEPLYLAVGYDGPTSGICTGTKHPEEALSLLALIGNDEEFRMQLAYGKEGQDYRISEDGYYQIIGQDNKSTYSLDFLFCLNYFSGLTADPMTNSDLFTPTTRHNWDRVPEGKTLLQAYEQRAKSSILHYPYSSVPLAEGSKSNVLSFDFSDYKKDLKKIKEVSDYYFTFYANPKDIKDNPNTKDEDESKPRMTKEKYDEMLQALRDAGSDKILAELQRQLDAWLAENPDWNK